MSLATVECSNHFAHTQQFSSNANPSLLWAPSWLIPKILSLGVIMKCISGRQFSQRLVVIVVVDFETHVNEFGHQQLDSQWENADEVLKTICIISSKVTYLITYS